MLSMLSLLLSLSAHAQPIIPIGVRGAPCEHGIPDGQVLQLDFGRLCRYEVANSRLGRASAQRVVYLGDSITEGWGNRIVGLTGDVVNRGISGSTTAQMLVRFRSDVINLRPRIVHIMAGTNDIAGNTGPTSIGRIRDALMSMAEQARSHGIRVVLASIPPAKAMGWSPTVTNALAAIRELNTWMKQYAAAEGFVYADYHSALADADGGLDARYGSDGVHPNREGFAVMERIATEAIRQANRDE